MKPTMAVFGSTTRCRRRSGAVCLPTEPGIFGAMLKQIAERVAGGETVSFRPTGHSMVPLIHSRDEVVVCPVDPPWWRWAILF